MGKLSGRALGSRLASGPGRLRAGRKDGGASLDRSRNWYNTAAWRKLRLRVLERDGYVCTQTGVVLAGKYPAPNSPVVDHKIPHRGDRALFFDEANLQSVSKAWHDSTKQSIEKRGDI